MNVCEEGIAVRQYCYIACTKIIHCCYLKETHKSENEMVLYLLIVSPSSINMHESRCAQRLHTFDSDQFVNICLN